MVNSFNHSCLIDSKSSLENHLNKMSSNATSDHPYLSLPKHWSSTYQSQWRMINMLPCLCSQQCSMLHGSQSQNTYAAGRPNLYNYSAHNILTVTSPKVLTLSETENKSNTSSPSIVIKHTTSWPLAVFSLVTDDKPIRAQLSLIRYEGVDDIIRANSTASEFLKAKGWLREPESPHTVSTVVWNGTTKLTADCQRCPETRSISQIATNMSTYFLWCDKQFHGPIMSHSTRTTAPYCTHHNTQHWQSGDCIWEWQPQDSNNGTIYGLFSPGPQTRGAGHPNEGIQCSSEITMALDLQAGDQLGCWVINSIQDHKCPRGGTQCRYDSAVV